MNKTAIAIDYEESAYVYQLSENEFYALLPIMEKAIEKKLLSLKKKLITIEDYMK